MFENLPIVIHASPATDDRERDEEELGGMSAGAEEPVKELGLGTVAVTLTGATSVRVPVRQHSRVDALVRVLEEPRDSSLVRGSKLAATAAVLDEDTAASQESGRIVATAILQRARAATDAATLLIVAVNSARYRDNAQLLFISVLAELTSTDLACAHAAGRNKDSVHLPTVASALATALRPLVENNRELATFVGQRIHTRHLTTEIDSDGLRCVGWTRTDVEAVDALVDTAEKTLATTADVD